MTPLSSRAWSGRLGMVHLARWLGLLGLLAGLGLAPMPAAAATVIQAPCVIGGAVTWVARAVYLVGPCPKLPTSDLGAPRVEAGATLTIPAGTIVKLAPGTAIAVNGALTTRGAA